MHPVFTEIRVTTQQDSGGEPEHCTGQGASNNPSKTIGTCISKYPLREIFSKESESNKDVFVSKAEPSPHSPGMFQVRLGIMIY